MKLRLLLISLAFPTIMHSQETGNQNSIRVGFQADFMRPAYPSYLYGRQVHKHESNVVYTHQTNGATITCDSAYHYYPSDTIEFFGNVAVRHESTVLSGEKIFYDGVFAKVRGQIVQMHNAERNATLKTQFVDYNIDRNVGTYSNGGTLVRVRDTIESTNGMFNGNTGVFTFIDNVAMKNDSIIVVCDTMLYDTHNDITTFIENTKAWNGNNFMMSNYGWYKPKENAISFSHNAYMRSATQEAWADSVFFDNATKSSALFRNIQMTDSTQNIIIFGDKANIGNNYETVTVTENPVILYYTTPNLPEQAGDTTYLAADTICSLYEKMQYTVTCDTCKTDMINDSTAVETAQDTLIQNAILRDTVVRNIFAYHNVKIYKSDFQALCDSLIYHSLDSTTHMFHSPLLWNDSTQISSGPATFYSKNQQMDYAKFASPALIAMREDTAYFNQLKGKSMKAFFKNNQLDHINVLGNGQSVYFIRETPEKPIAAVEISECANIIIQIITVDGQNKISKVSYLAKPKSNTYPLIQLPEDLKTLQGFVWHSDIRPKSKNDIFSRQIRQSQRSLSQTFNKPEFQITARVNRYVHEK